jgi:aryl-alcohol dehydrogenase-like predicted oxidoreductase
METTTLGRGGPVVSRAGLGLMGMSGIYGRADDQESIATIRAALDAGITLLDTGDFYGMGHNELLLRDALRGVRRDSVFIQVKFGGQRDPSGAFIGHDASPAAVKNSLAYTLTRLGTDYVDLYQPARLDPRVPIEETVGAIAEMIRAGYVRHVGLSETGADTIRRAHAVHPITALQIEYSLMSRGIEAEILPAVRELGIGVTAYGILSRGLLSSGTARLAPGDPRTRFPRFSGENHARNLELLAALEAIAEEKEVTAAQLAIAWVASRGEDIIPLIGTKRRDRLAEALEALDLTLSADDLAAVEAAVPAGAVTGGRYDAAQLAMLDSERLAPGFGHRQLTGGERLDRGLRVQHPVQARGQGPADQRRDDEQPYLAQGGPADDESRAEAAGRVHRRAGDRDPDEMDHGEAQADDDAGGGGVRGLARGAEHGEDEKGGHDHLDQEGTSRVDVDMARRAPAIRAQARPRPAVQR